jgi:hypothetical protein
MNFIFVNKGPVLLNLLLAIVFHFVIIIIYIIQDFVQIICRKYLIYNLRIYIYKKIYINNLFYFEK